MSHGGGRLRCKQVTTGRLEEFQNRLVLERRRVRQIDNDLCARKCVSQAFARNGVDARIW
jgi:hypothetical protein